MNIPAFKKRVNLDNIPIKIENIENKDPKKIVDGVTYVWGNKKGKVTKREIVFDSSIYKEMNEALDKFNKGLVLEEIDFKRIVGFMHEVGHTKDIYVNRLKKNSPEYFLSEGLNEKFARMGTASMITDRYKGIEKEEIKDMLSKLDSWAGKGEYYNNPVKTIEKALSWFDKDEIYKIYIDMREKLIKTKHEKIFETVEEVMKKYNKIKAGLSMIDLRNIKE